MHQKEPHRQVMVIHSLLLNCSPPFLQKGRGGSHGHTQPSSHKLSSFSWKREGMVVMMIQSLPLKSSSPLLGKGRGSGHGHTKTSSEKLSSSSWKGTGRWSWSYKAFFSKALLLFLEREGVVVMVIHNLPLKSSPSFLGHGRDGSHGHTQPPSCSSGKRGVVVVMAIQSLLFISSSLFLGKGREWWSWSYTAFL